MLWEDFHVEFPRVSGFFSALGHKYETIMRQKEPVHVAGHTIPKNPGMVYFSTFSLNLYGKCR